MKRMLFNATHPEELRIAVVDGQKLLDLDIESTLLPEKKGNIYKAIVSKVEPSLDTCFVDYGAEKHGFLPFKEIHRSYFQDYDPSTPISNIKIESVIKEGQEMIVQIDKNERGNKGAVLTTFISLAGRFLVLMPNNPKGGGISHRIAGEERAQLKQALANLELDTNHALIARTAGIGRSDKELQWDLNFLTKLWDSISNSSKNIKAPYLIYQESNRVARSIRDHFSAEINEIIIDDQEIFERAKIFMNQIIPHCISKLKLYQESVPLFSRYQIEQQICSAFNREVHLPSGGSIIIDHTEAMISIDVNSARSTKGGDIEETALSTNLEAVEELARQLRIRDLGGLVVIDLIDMTMNINQRKVEYQLKESLKTDHARVQIGQISKFGLLEMSRQRLRSSISDSNYRSCPRCNGMGTIRNVISSSLHLLRLIEEEALKENTEAIQAFLPLDIATYLMNEKRHDLNSLENRLVSRITIIPSEQLKSPHFQIRRLKSEELDQLTDVSSYKQKLEVNDEKTSFIERLTLSRIIQQKTKINQTKHGSTAFHFKQFSFSNKIGMIQNGIFKRIVRSIFGKHFKLTKNKRLQSQRKTLERGFDSGNHKMYIEKRKGRSGQQKRGEQNNIFNQQHNQNQLNSCQNSNKGNRLNKNSSHRLNQNKKQFQHKRTRQVSELSHSKNRFNKSTNVNPQNHNILNHRQKLEDPSSEKTPLSTYKDSVHTLVDSQILNQKD